MKTLNEYMSMSYKMEIIYKSNKEDVEFICLNYGVKITDEEFEKAKAFVLCFPEYYYDNFHIHYIHFQYLRILHSNILENIKRMLLPFQTLHL